MIFTIFFGFFSVAFCTVHEIYSRYHFHDLIQDLPVGYRYASVIAFYNESNECNKGFEKLNFEHKNLPSNEFLMLGRYEMSNIGDRFWFKFEEEMDLAKYLNINQHINIISTCGCPLLAYIPFEYSNEINDNYLNTPKHSNIEYWDCNKEKNWKKWIWSFYQKNISIIQSEPFDLEITIIPGINNPFYNNSKKTLSSYIIKSIQSHTNIPTYIHDQIYISKNPQHLIQMNINVNNDINIIDNPSNNPVYTITSDMKKLYVTKLDNNRYGFIINRRQDITSHLIEARHRTTTSTHTHNSIIPIILPKYDRLGFKKLKMPNGLHERLLHYYQTWYHERKAETWDNSATQLNYFNVKSYLISLDLNWQERNAIANDIIKPILEEWSGKKLEFTSFYGIREYARGASLRNHVDRSETHIFSAILQIAQTGMDEDWPLEVIGFDGIRYEIIMQPGEMVLYEGSTLIHGRPQPLQGDLFSNAFCHFKPIDWNWNMNSIFTNSKVQPLLQKLHVLGKPGIYW